MDRRAACGPVRARPCIRGPLSALPEPGRVVCRAGRGSLSLFELEDVSFTRAGARVLSDLSLRIEPGATALLGPSGSGKSSVLRLLNRLSDPDQGVVRMDGDDVRELDVLELRRRAVLVPQLPAPLPGTVGDNVRYGPSLAGREVDVGALLVAAGLDRSYTDRDAAQLSVGEQQRVMLARALALEPDVLLLDEPTSALDETARDEIERTLVDLAGRVSMVLVTHDRAQAERLTERTIRIREGRADAA